VGDDKPSAPRPETLKVICAIAQTSPSEQLRAAEAVDSKIFQALAAGSVLIGLAAVQAGEHDDLKIAFLAAAVAAFLVLATLAIPTLWSRRFRIGMGPDQLWNDYWSNTPDQIRHAYVDDIVSGYQQNEKLLASKHKALRGILLALLAEVCAIASALISSAA